MKGFNRLLVAHGLNVKNLCAVEPKHISPGHSVADDVTDDGGCKLRSCIKTIPSLLEICCISLPVCDHTFISTLTLPHCVNEFILQKPLKTMNPFSIVKIDSKYEF